MPNKCTVCGKVHPDDAKYLVKGCDKCGSKFFFYVRKEMLERAEEDIKQLSTQELREIEDDIRYIVPEDVKKEDTVILDVEAIRVIKPGKYRIDVTNLFTQRPIVIRVGPGKYELDLSTLMTRLRRSRPEGAENI
ncbi:MAG: Zn-ribbon domain-containing protein [Candidatus Aenigmatarchaeota archaeon]